VLAADTHEEGSAAMPYTDIVKARAIRRAGRACEMCGTPLKFDSAHYVSAHPIFGILFDQDDCCVLCHDCLDDLDNETRAAVEESRSADGDGSESGGGLAESGHARQAGSDPADAAKRGRDDAGRQATTRGSWLPERGPDDDMCA
jgi:hypothetical protein